ncbi:undecaprenyldiphospho-muramoylpentapeptide beta-N-acetylglucosaminyltransferase [Rhodohalobacter sp. 8-1]|uniref:undecaprenyldiphospho-muramoylpentapeptide beta-N-acetylglucosaminyltransferase n=1 Tax=Rhodohalobacter sp. 8-1 TaxID=3131972 RepID=UPI0030EE6BC9
MTSTKQHIDAPSGSTLNPLRILLAAGGTGGHVYPAIAIADAVKGVRSDSEILFVGTRDRMEWQAVPSAGYDIKSVWISGFHRRLTPQNLLFPVKLVTSLVQSFSILKRFKPDVVVACGGFAAGPVGWVAAKLGVPLAIQEQNSYPGVTNRILAKHAVKIFTAFEAAEQYLPENKIELTGNPVRNSLKVSDKQDALDHFRFSDDKPVLLILGGSGGAKALNDAMAERLDELHDEYEIQIIWQCGEKYYKNLSTSINEKEYPNLRLLGYIDDMPAAYGAATLVLTRAGASTCSELMIIGKPSVLVPSPNVAGDHQTKNAAAMVDEGASVLISEEELSDAITNKVPALLKDDEKLQNMSQAALKLAKPDAANQIAKQLFELAKRNNSHE